jgi:regulator of protease activity HflC (stomatin/prohibitin superfamily)
LAAERNSQAQLVEARTKAEVQRIEAQTRAEAKRVESEAESQSHRLREEVDAEVARVRAAAELRAVQERQKIGTILRENPELLRLEELQTLRELAQNANARIYIGFDRPRPSAADLKSD